MRKRLISSLALAAALLLSACGFGAASEPPVAADVQSAPADASAAGRSAPTTEEDANLTITFGAFSFMRPAYEPLIAAFNQQHPGITVQFVSLDATYQGGGDQNEQTRQIASLADTAEAETNGEQFQQGLLYDLTPLIDGDPSFDRDDFYPGALSSATSAGGAIYKLPLTLHVPLLFYNKDLWAARNLAVPKPDWTWQDVEAAAQQLAQKQGSTVRVYGLADDDAHLAVLLTKLNSAGLDLLSTPPASARVDRPEVVAALERMGDLFASGVFYLGSENRDAQNEVVQLIVDQQVAMWGSRFAEVVAGMRAPNGGPALRFTPGVALFPPSPTGATEATRGYVMSSGTEHPNEAWIWLSFLSKQVVADQAGGKGGSPSALNSLPARKSLAEQSGYWSRLDDETKAAVEAALARPTPALPNTRILEAYDPLGQAIRDIVGGKSAAQAAAEAQAAITNLVAQAQLTPTAAANEPIEVATPAPNVAPPGAAMITFGMPLPKGEGQAAQLVQEFNQSDQGVFVQLKNTFTGGANDLMSVPEAAAQADCFASWFPPAQSELTATLDLQPLLDADPSFQLDDYPAALLTPYRQGDQLHGLPWGFNPRVVNYNKERFDAAGLQPPAPEWTMDDFLHAAQKLTGGQGNAKQYGFVMSRGTSEGVKFLVHLLGAATLQGSGETLRPNFTDPNVVQAAGKVVDLLKNDTPHTRLDDYSPASGLDEFRPLEEEGRVGMSFGWGLYPPTPWPPQNPRFTIAAAVPPLAQAALDTDDVWPSSMYISAQTDQQQACWIWLKHFSTRTGLFADFPARRSVAHSDAMNQEHPGLAAAYDAYAAALDRTGQLPPGGHDPKKSPIDYYWFYQAIDRALQGKNLEQELAAAQALTEQYLACLRSGGQHQVCTRQVDPDYQGWP
ncbi:MAG TPA: extracellular solute-binding protein [Roseiflexaceae bacterium]|nr:extracellular solute-binding protein [Roseiflexaceae bacterium]